MARNLTLLTDLYELTMMNSFFKNGMHKNTAVFDAFFRKQNQSNYAVFAGLADVIDYINKLEFNTDDIEYLRGLGLFGEDFLSYLKTFRFSGSIKAVREGTVVFPDEPLVIVKAPLIEAVFIESALLNIINHQTLIATKASRIAFSAGGGVVEFGLRRAQGADAAILGARAAIIGGASATSNVYSAKKYGMTAAGTMAHSYIMSFPDELTAFREYAKTYPDNCMFLVDTYDTLASGVPNAIKVFSEIAKKGHKPIGIRLDSGDFAYLSKRAREMLDSAGFSDALIMCSGDLDEYVIQSLRVQGAKIDLWGVGTRLITSFDMPALGGVYKLAALTENGKLTPKIKLSDNEEKTTIPGEKEVYRLYNREKKAIADLITLSDETIDPTRPLTIFHPLETWKKKTLTDFTVEKLLTDIFVEGKQVYFSPDTSQICRYKQEKFSEFWEEYKRLDRPQLYIVDLSERLYNMRKQMIENFKNGRQA